LLEVKSPIPGVIIADFSKGGDRIDNVSSIYTVADLSKLGVTFDVYEKDIGKIKLGQKVLVRSVAYSEKTFHGKIVFVSKRVDETTRTIKTRALIENTDYSLKLGMFVSGEIIVESEEKYLVLPASAVQVMGDKRMVFIKTDDGHFKKKEIEIKSETKNEVAVSEGIKEGDLVVADGAFLLKSELLKDELEGE
jgi:cobalt-zinc-cadmium efflux system membrane fusion protein